LPRKVLTSKDAQNLTVDFEEQAIVKRQLSPFRVLADLGCSELYQYAAKKVGSINPVCHKELGNYKVIYHGVLTTFLVQIQWLRVIWTTSFSNLKKLYIKIEV
jgi:hypothetical protein